jgi:hypothetical protein
MYIAHKCTKCWKCDIVYNFGQTTYSCRGCGHTENEAAFWAANRSEQYLRELEEEIESRFPFKDITLIGCSIDLAVGWHALGKYDGRDYCIEAILKSIKELHDKWGICYSNFDKVERRIAKYEQIGNHDESAQYKEHLDSMRDFFKDFPPKMKEACK